MATKKKKAQAEPQDTAETQSSKKNASATEGVDSEPRSYIPTTQTGLQDYSYWWAYCRENAKTVKANTKTFRRGRIWS